MNPAPAFQFYAADFLADKNVAVMSAEEVGAYILLLSYCWREGSLPDDKEELATLARMPLEKFEQSWARRLLRCFEMSEDGEWRHPRLEAERVKQAANRVQKQNAAHKRHHPSELPADADAMQTHSTCNADALQTECLSSSSSSSIQRTHTHSARARGDDPDSLPEDSPPVSPPRPFLLEHEGVQLHWHRFHVELSIGAQEIIAREVTDLRRWGEALDFWEGNNYRPQSAEKIVKKYRELAEANHHATGKQRDAQLGGNHQPQTRGNGRSTRNERIERDLAEADDIALFSTE